MPVNSRLGRYCHVRRAFFLLVLIIYSFISYELQQLQQLQHYPTTTLPPLYHHSTTTLPPLYHHSTTSQPPQTTIKQWTPDFNIVTLAHQRRSRRNYHEQAHSSRFWSVYYLVRNVLDRNGGLGENFFRIRCCRWIHHIKNIDSILSQIVRIFISHGRLLITGTLGQRWYSGCSRGSDCCNSSWDVMILEALDAQQILYGLQYGLWGI
jgi:hypothetical protein